ncbi:DUF3013 family protein [Fundicoccus culcitae]|uniref:DUF3013 family protein n=1 Tax=Fundicoccus culcitae TaxID=2969821 RepID=A0ABY5P6G8_9LACT|nr:DUF3013 family protein [Fundicoccus culcitae]UUX34326.1 DUF3013 family protein [Fundicoccus culcitae]
MDKNNILAVLEQLIIGQHFQCEWGIEWNEQQHYFELIFQFSLPNPNGISFKDAFGNSISYTTIPYETSILFYDKDHLNVEHSNYVNSIPISHNQGIAYGELFAIVKYLKHLTSSVRVEWLDYLFDSPHDAYFEICWNDHDFAQIKKGLIEANRYNSAPVFFPKNEAKGGLY